MKAISTTCLLLFSVILSVAVIVGCSNNKNSTSIPSDNHGEHTQHSGSSPSPPSSLSNTHQNQVSQIPGYGEVRIDNDKAKQLGVTTQKVTIRKLTHTLRTVGIVEIDETRIAHIQTKFSGWIQDLYIDYIGKPVKSGQPLFSVYSPDLVATQEEYLLALRGGDQKVEGPFSSEIERMTRSLITASQRRLERWDIPREEIERLRTERTLTKAIIIKSPHDGVVLKKTAVKGMNVEPTMDLFEIADLSRVWIPAEVHESDIPHVRLGQQVTLKLDALPGRELRGSIEFINPVLNETTRTMKVRIGFNNRKLILKPGMYAVVELKHEMGKVLAIPEDAVIDTGLRKLVFVKISDDQYVPREVQLGNKLDGYYQLLSGLSENDEIVTGAQFMLDSESRLRSMGGKIGGHGSDHAGMKKDNK